MHETTSTITTLKNLSYIPALFVGLSMESYIILAILMLVDTLFGIIRVGVIYGGGHIKSYKLISGILSKLTVIGVPVMFVWAGRGAGMDFTPIAQATLSVLVLAEFYSILGNVYAIHIKKDVLEYDAVSVIIHSIQKILEKVLKDKQNIQPKEKEDENIKKPN